VRPTAETLNQGLSGQLRVVRPQLEAARQALVGAADAWARVPIDELTPPLRDRLKRVGDLLPLARNSIDLALIMPDLLGADGRRDYLLIAQNSDEIRATGGFISGAGVLTVDHGRLANVAIGDSVDVDNLAGAPYPDPPQPLLHYMGIELWVFRDTNWSPDFPTSARAALDLYKLGQQRPISNVIAFDPAAVQMLLSVTGPIDVAGIPFPISTENVIQNMRSPYNMPWDDGREEFKRRLAMALITRIEAKSPQLDIVALARAVERALDERHILIYLQDTPAVKILAERGWDGSVRPGLADFLMVVDSNLGYNKVNPNIQEAISYTVDLSDPNAPMAELTIRHTHQLKRQAPCQQWATHAISYEDWMNRCYYDYLRVLISGGSELISASTQPVPREWLAWAAGDGGEVTASAGEAGTNVLSTFLVVPLGGERTTSFRYHLAPSVLVRDAHEQHYRLTIQKQAGTDAIPVVIQVRLPTGAVVTSTSLLPTIRTDTMLSFAFNLNQDRTLDLVFRTP